MALLSVVVVGSLYTSRIDLTSTKLHGDRIQAYYLALAGVETAKALIYEDAKDRSQRSTHHTGALYEDPSQFQDIPFPGEHFAWDMQESKIPKACGPLAFEMRKAG
jgi:type II secretory pathway component PulK